MNFWSRCRLALVIPFVLSCAEPQGAVRELYRAPAISDTVDGVVFEPGDWEPHLPAGAAGESWGNHRAVVEIDEPVDGEAIFVTIPWRRDDPDPAAKGVVVVDAATGERVRNAVALRIDNVSGDVVFQPNPNSSVYHVYYMPWRSTGGYYPRLTYLSGGGGNDPAWERAVRSLQPAELPQARTTRIQSVNAFHSFFPMEVIASDSETADFMSRAAGGWALVAEHRDYPVRMRHFIPRHWMERVQPNALSSRVLRGESFAFQLAVVAGDAPLAGLEVGFDGFPPSWRESLTCFNCGGIDERGVQFEKQLSVPAGSVQPLWIGVRIPEDQRPGTYEGTVTVSSRRRGSKTARISLAVEDGRAENAGFDQPELMTRLAWLNSTLGSDPNLIIKPFEPIRVSGRSLSILGRRVDLAPSGLPQNIYSYFTPELTGFAAEPQSLLAQPIDLQVAVDGRAERFQPGNYAVVQEARGRVRWTVQSRSPRFSQTVDGTLEYDGMLDYRITLVALADVAVDDISLPISLLPDGAEYMLGLGYRGGRRPASVDWKWKVENHQEGVWLGGLQKGLQYVLRDENYVRPLNTNFYRNQPLNMPPSWFNDGRGGIRIETEADAVTALNYSGPRSLSAGDTLHFNVRFLVTPFKPIDTRRHFNTRFVHQYVPVDSVIAWGGTVVNIHHANEINPYINYPFYNLEQQAAYIDEAHRKGIKVKLYYTIRELSYRAYELFALRSLGDEILNDGEGGGYSWLQEHLVSHYHPGWRAWRVDDAAVLDKGTSRWTNYYIEGLGWLASHQHIDGLYLDDIAFSRETVKRLVNVLEEERGEYIIDLHSANQFNERDGYINSAMLYMEHFPFITRLWFGEYFEYDRDPDYWLTEVSGLPFGLMGEMLQGGGHPYRGLLYGMTARKYGDTDPRPVWRMMDDFGIADSRMLGYWLDDAPVRTDHPRVLATAYVRDDGVLIALASWSESDQTVALTLDREVLGIESGWRARAPAVEGLQAAADVDLSAVPVPANQGLFIVVRPAAGN